MMERVPGFERRRNPWRKRTQWKRRSETWQCPDGEVEHLHNVATIFANALARRDRERELRSAPERIQRLQAKLEAESLYPNLANLESGSYAAKRRTRST